MRALLLFVVAWSSVAQAEGTLEGRITLDQAPVPNAIVFAKNRATGASTQATTNKDGTYQLRLPSGSYEILIRGEGAYSAITRPSETIVDGKVLQIDGKLERILNLDVPGELSYIKARSAATVPVGQTPKTADGHPDFSGVWYPGPDLPNDEATPFQPWAAAITAERAADSNKDDPRAHCLPSGVVRGNQLDLAKIVQTPTLIVMLVEGSPPGFRQIFLDGRGHPADLSPSWMGHSIGSWDGNALVVDTIGFHDRGWIDVTGRPQTERLHVIERFERTDLAHIALEITVDDPGAYTKPWKVRRILQLAPTMELMEYVCNERPGDQHFVGK
jgi:hypothetical protein